MNWKLKLHQIYEREEDVVPESWVWDFIEIEIIEKLIDDVIAHCPIHGINSTEPIRQQLRAKWLGEK